MKMSPLALFASAGMAAAIVGSSLAAAAPTSPASVASAATVPMSRQFDLVSKASGQAYRVRISIPTGKPPARGWPILYVLDGDVYFGGVVGAALVRGPVGGEIEPPVVVGIGYPDSDNLQMIFKHRVLDLTPVPPSGAIGASNATGPKIESAGADKFLQAIKTEIEPRVAETVKVDTTRTAIWGHSLGGLFVLNTLFTHPESFATYVAISPSIVWGSGDLLKKEPGFATRLAKMAVGPRVFIGVGQREQWIPRPLPPGATEATLQRFIDETREVDNCVELAGRLAGLKGPPEYLVKSKVFTDETHVSVPWASLNAALDFALPPPAASTPH